MGRCLLVLIFLMTIVILAAVITILVFSVMEYESRNPPGPVPPGINANSLNAENPIGDGIPAHAPLQDEINVRADYETVVYTEYGSVRGYQQFTLFENKSYYAFKGIPYARPPLAELRFKPPQRATHWNGIREAFEFGSNCMQPEVPFGSEDCLFINVYTPKAVKTQQYPVVMVVHGGGAFRDGSADTIGPDFLLNQDNVVVVTFNYRLGPLGFMSLRSHEYPGNMGLKDQLMAMQWTHQNVQNFGGDISKITLYGSSGSGAQSAHMHVLSPASRGLFHRSVMASGTALQPSAVSSANHAEKLRRFAVDNGKSVDNEKELLDYLLDVDAYLLTKSVADGVNMVADARKGIPLYWVPVVEPADAEQPFLTELPATILNAQFRTPVDLMFTFVSDESYAFIDEELGNPSLLHGISKEFAQQIPVNALNIGSNQSSELLRSLLVSNVKKFYFGEHSHHKDRDSLYAYSTLVSDLHFNYAIDMAVRLHAAAGFGKTFYSRFSVDGAFNVLKKTLHASTLGLPGATHTDEAMYLWGTSGLLSDLYNSVAIDSIERRVINEFSKLHTDFMQHGSPAPSNEAFGSVETDRVNFLDVTNEGMVTGTNPNGARMQFWSKLMSTMKR